MADILSYIRKLKGHTVVGWNIRSLLSKIEEVDRLILLDPEIVGISETRLNDTIDDSMISVSGYNMYRADRTVNSGKKSGDGLIIYYKNNLRIQLQHKLTVCDPDIEMMWVRLELTNTRSIYYGLIYRPLTGNLDNFLNHLKVVTEILRGRVCVK